jgi:hypothetical protein
MWNNFGNSAPAYVDERHHRFSATQCSLSNSIKRIQLELVSLEQEQDLPLLHPICTILEGHQKTLRNI